MATYSGFFNSVGGDRRYDATDFSRFFDGLIKDGVYVNFPETNDDSAKGLHVSANTEITGLNVKVAPGRCWFNGFWMYNDAFLNIALDPTTNTLVSRIDAIVVDVNGADSSREVNIITVKGDQATNPDKPSMIHTATRNQYPLAYVTVVGGVTSISASNIEDCISSGETPAVEALLEYSSRSKAQLKEYIDSADSNLQNQVNNIKTPTFDEATELANLAGTGENINVMWGKIKKLFSTIIGILPVNYGGTGKSTHASNSVLLGNGNSTLKNKATANGAFYATGNNQEPQFGTLPAAQGGTGNTTLQATRNAMGLGNTTGALPVANGGTGKSTNTANSVLLGNGGSAIKNKATAAGAFYADADNGEPKFGTLPVNRGGTGQTTAAGIRNTLGLGNTTDPVPVANGGTGASTAAQALANLGVPSDVSKAMSKDVYCSQDENRSTIDVAHGGTGTSDGTLNGVKLAISGDSKGYIDANGNFKSFRQPTGTATAAQVLDGIYFANVSSDSIKGTMPNNGAVSQALNAGGSYTVPAGYHNGSGKVTANSLASQTGVDSGKTAVAAAQMLTGYQGWVNGNKVSGTMANKGAWTGATTGNGNVTIPAGYHNGSGYVSGSGAYNAGVNAQKAVYWDETVTLSIDGALTFQYPLYGISHWKCSDTSTEGSYNGSISAGNPANNNSWHDCTNASYKDIRFNFYGSKTVTFTVRRVCYKVKS